MAPNYESDDSGTDEDSVESAEEVAPKKRSKKAWKGECRCVWNGRAFGIVFFETLSL